MNSPAEAPKLKPWLFLAGDAALLVTAFYIAASAKAPLVGRPLIAVVTCVGLGAVLAVFPFVVTYTRRHELELFERQNEIAALAQSTANSAEQLSIAVASLHGIAETASKNLRVAEQLPQKLQEKINDFKIQLNEVAVTDNEALAQEVNTLRATETERLESALTAIRKTAAELVALESSTRGHITQLGQALTRFSAEAAGAAQETAANISRTGADVEKSLALREAATTRLLENTLNGAIAQLQQEFDRASETLITRISQATARLGDPPQAFSASTESLQKPKRHDEAIAGSPESTDSSLASTPNRTATVSTSEESSENLKPTVRRRPARKQSTGLDELGQGLDAPTTAAPDEFTQASREESMIGPAVSPDGYTRLLVTAYIGIGNKLYARGEGPGLNWDTGVPLQFVSIGKWRWESAEASSPVSLKLYKNDELECSGLGTVVLEPSHQQEITANF